MKDFLLEIGVENMPASYIAPAVAQLRGDAAKLLEESRLDFDDVYATGTPRRLVLVVRALAARQRAAKETITGPPVSKAFDDTGNPTPAGAGFARSQGIPVEKLARIETAKGEYVGVERKLPQRATSTLLSEAIPGLIARLRFPKTMKWEATGARFARPIRWIVALHGTASVRVEFAGVASANRTYKRPWFEGESAVVRSAGAYAGVMKKLGIIVDQDERRDRIRALAQRAAGREGASVVEDEGLIDELTFMLEDPHVLLGSFSDEYLKLPAEVVTTAMRSHQRYIALTDERGKLVPSFITFTDGKPLGPAVVRDGNEKVLRARLEDAQFYWREDLSRGMDGLADELDRIVFIEGLGTIGEKWRRVARVGSRVNDQFGDDERVDAAQVERAARLSKADLASEMIKDGKEFTLLQGVIGSQYARASKEDRAVVAAIREHYQPRGPQDRTPRTPLGAAIGIADRVDTIAGCFIAGFKPTGSQDPYALRRSANGLIRIAHRRPAIRLDLVIDASLDSYGDAVAPEVRADLVEFFTLRCDAFLRDQRVPYDVADAVVPLCWTQPGVALERARDIARLRGDEVFERLITGVKRVGNILGPGHRRLGVSWERIDAAFNESGDLFDGVRFSSEQFDHDSERDLFRAVRTALPGIANSESSHQFRDILNTLSTLADPIDEFFDNVLVNCEDAQVRQNRHAFLAAIYAVFSRYADFSSIVEQGADPSTT